MSLKNIVIGLGVVSAMMLSQDANAQTTFRCSQKIFADLFSCVTVPAGTKCKKIADNAHYSTLYASGSADNSAQIAALVAQVAQVKGLSLSKKLKNQMIKQLNNQIDDLRSGEKSLARARCRDSVKSQAHGVQAPHKFARRGSVVFP